jgi:hypothetical protein
VRTALLSDCFVTDRHAGDISNSIERTGRAVERNTEITRAWGILIAQSHDGQQKE